MKHIFFLLLICSCLFACGLEKYEHNNFRFGATIYQGGIDGYSIVYCDSFQMITTTQAILYVDGSALTVKAKNGISFWSNTAYQPKTKNHKP